MYNFWLAHGSLRRERYADCMRAKHRTFRMVLAFGLLTNCLNRIAVLLAAKGLLKYTDLQTPDGDQWDFGELQKAF